MRTHGAKELGDTLKTTPKRQLQPVFEVSFYLPLLQWASWNRKDVKMSCVYGNSMHATQIKHQLNIVHHPINILCNKFSWLQGDFPMMLHNIENLQTFYQEIVRFIKRKDAGTKPSECRILEKH